IRKVIENPSALRTRALLPGGTAGVDALDIQVGGDAPIELRKLSDGWKLFGGGEAKAANTPAIQGLLTELGSRRLIRDFPDPKLKEPTAKLVFGKRDKDVLYVRREQGGTKADFAVPESLLPKLTRGRLDYLDPTLPSFLADKVAKLTFTRGGETWAVEKQTKE